MGAQLVAQTVSGNYVVSNTSFAPNISGGFSISLWFSCSGQLNKTGTLISLPYNKTGNGLEIDVSGTNMLLSGWNAPLPLPSVTTSLVAYFPLSNTTQESVSGLTVTAATGVTYNTVSSRTGIVCTSSTGYGTSGQTSPIVNTSTGIVNYNIPTFTLPFTTNGVSFSLWVYPTNIGAQGAWQLLFNLSDNTYSAASMYVISIANNMMQLHFANGMTPYYAGYTQTSGITINNNNWYHIVYTLTNGVVLTSYVNNTSYISNATTTVPGDKSGLNITTNNSFAIGCATFNAYKGAGFVPSAYNSFTGTISKVAVYNTILTSAQVTTLYNAGNG